MSSLSSTVPFGSPRRLRFTPSSLAFTDTGGWVPVASNVPSTSSTSRSTVVGDGNGPSLYPSNSDRSRYVPRSSRGQHEAAISGEVVSLMSMGLEEASRERDRLAAQLRDQDSLEKSYISKSNKMRQDYEQQLQIMKQDRDKQRNNAEEKDHEILMLGKRLYALLKSLETSSSSAGMKSDQQLHGLVRTASDVRDSLMNRGSNVSESDLDSGFFHKFGKKVASAMGGRGSLSSGESADTADLVSLVQSLEDHLRREGVRKSYSNEDDNSRNSNKYSKPSSNEASGNRRAPGIHQSAAGASSYSQNLEDALLSLEGEIGTSKGRDYDNGSRKRSSRQRGSRQTKARPRSPSKSCSSDDDSESNHEETNRDDGGDRNRQGDQPNALPSIDHTVEDRSAPISNNTKHAPNDGASASSSNTETEAQNAPVNVVLSEIPVEDVVAKPPSVFTAKPASAWGRFKKGNVTGSAFAGGTVVEERPVERSASPASPGASQHQKHHAHNASTTVHHHTVPAVKAPAFSLSDVIAAHKKNKRSNMDSENLTLKQRILILEKDKERLTLENEYSAVVTKELTAQVSIMEDEARDAAAKIATTSMELSRISVRADLVTRLERDLEEERSIAKDLRERALSSELTLLNMTKDRDRKKSEADELSKSLSQASEKCNTAYIEIERLKKDIDSINHRYKEGEVSCSNYKKTIEDLEEQLVIASTALSKKDHQIDMLKEKLSQCIQAGEKTSQQLESSLALIASKDRDIEDQRVKLQNKMKFVDDALAVKQGEFNSISSAYSSTSAELIKLREAFKLLELKVEEITPLRKERDDLRRELELERSSTASLKAVWHGEISDAQSYCSSLGAEVEDLRKDADRMQLEAEEAWRSAERTKDELEEERWRCRGARAETERMQLELQGFRDRERWLTTQVVTLEERESSALLAQFEAEETARENRRNYASLLRQLEVKLMAMGDRIGDADIGGSGQNGVTSPYWHAHAATQGSNESTLIKEPPVEAVVEAHLAIVQRAASENLSSSGMDEVLRLRQEIELFRVDSKNDKSAIRRLSNDLKMRDAEAESVRRSHQALTDSLTLYRNQIEEIEAEIDAEKQCKIRAESRVEQVRSELEKDIRHLRTRLQPDVFRVEEENRVLRAREASLLSDISAVQQRVSSLEIDLEKSLEKVISTKAEVAAEKLQTAEVSRQLSLAKSELDVIESRAIYDREKAIEKIDRDMRYKLQEMESSFRNDLNQLAAMFNSVSAQSDATVEQVRQLGRNIQSIMDETDNFSKACRENSDQCRTLQGMFENIKRLVAEQERKLSDIAKEFQSNTKDVNDAFQQVANDRLNLVQQLEAAKRELFVLKTELHGLQSEEEYLKRELSSARSAKDSADAKLDQVSEVLETERRTWQTTKDKLNNEISDLRHTLENMEHVHNEVKLQLETAMENIRALPPAPSKADIDAEVEKRLKYLWEELEKAKTELTSSQLECEAWKKKAVRQRSESPAPTGDVVDNSLIDQLRLENAELKEAVKAKQVQNGLAKMGGGTAIKAVWTQLEESKIKVRQLASLNAQLTGKCQRLEIALSNAKQILRKNGLNVREIGDDLTNSDGDDDIVK